MSQEKLCHYVSCHSTIKLSVDFAIELYWHCCKIAICPRNEGVIKTDSASNIPKYSCLLEHKFCPQAKKN